MTNVVAFKTPERKRTVRRRAPHWVRARRREAFAGAGVLGVGVSMMALSLNHLASGISMLTGASSSESWLMSVGFDCGFVALEVALIFAATEKVRKIVGRYAKPTIFATMLASAGLNGLAFAEGAHGWMIYPAAAIGISIPCLIYALTRCGTALWTAK